MNIGNLVLSVALSVPDETAVSFRDASLSYSELSRRARALAGGLVALGLKPGERVLLQMHNCLNYPEILIGCWTAGLVVVPVNAKLHVKEISHILENSGAKLIFTSQGVGSVETEIPVILAGAAAYDKLLATTPLADMVPTAPEDLAWLFYTSGTTGRPKGAMLSNRALLAMANAYFADVDHLDPDDTMLVAAPMSHGAGLYVVPALLKGAHVVIMPGFDIDETTKLLRQYKQISLFAVPTILNRLTAAWQGADLPLSHIRTIIYGGAPMYVADLERAIDLFGQRLFQLFAQGETPMTVSGLPKRLHRRDLAESQRFLSSSGYARTGTSIRICDPKNGQVMPTGETGEICAQSEAVMTGYWANPDATGKAIVDGWLRTGDLGYCDADGLLHIIDRSKDMIISGGTNIYPREVEEALLSHEDVAEVAVIGAPDPDWGESVVAFVVARAGVTLDEAVLDTHVCQHIARFKRPKHYRFINALPKSDYAKVLKSELREIYAATVVTP